MELSFVVNLLESAMKMLHWQKVYEVRVDDESIVIGEGITLYRDQVEIKATKSIINPDGPRKLHIVQGWSVDVAIETAPSRWEPGDVDIQKVHSSQSVLNCIDFITELCFNHLKDGNFRYLEHLIEVEETKLYGLPLS